MHNEDQIMDPEGQVNLFKFKAQEPEIHQKEIR